MRIALEILFWICVLGVIHSYVFFPAFISFLAKRRSKKDNATKSSSELPFVSILMAAFNEEEVIVEKMESVLQSQYPKEKYEILVGSDCSTDATNELLQKMQKQYPDCLHFYPFKTRQGKPGIINKLVNDAKGSILILTDANVIFDKLTLLELTKPFCSSTIGLVDSQMLNRGEKISGISYQEKAYISREVQIKHHESELWGAMMGPFGGCFAIRKELYHPVPSNFLVDDFYLNMYVLERGYQAINNPKALVYEDVSNNLAIEYRRKIRIATGNFQNLKRFKKLLWPPWNGRSFAFLSHKVLRWLGPFFIIILWITSAALSFHSRLYFTFFLAGSTLLLLPLFDHYLKKLSIHISLFRFITHFCAMNLALFVGFLRYIKGVKTNVWQPTKRNQK